MGRVGVDRLNTGLATAGGGSGGGTTNSILTAQTINNGVTTITHTLGAQPETVTFFRSTGEILVLQWTPTSGNETTQIDVTNAMPQFTGVTIQLAVSS